MTTPTTFSRFFASKRAAIYLVWMLLVPPGYLLLFFDPKPSHLFTWAIISAFGLGYMAYVMPLRLKRMLLLFLTWLFVIVVSIGVTAAALTVAKLSPLLPFLPVIWFLMQAFGFGLTGVLDSHPRRWYWIATGLHVCGAILLLALPVLNDVDYLILAIISGWAFALLWLLRSPYE